MHRYTQYFAVCFSALLFLPAISAYGERDALNQINLSITTDKRIYYAGEIAKYTVRFADPQGRALDPDLIRATYDSQFIKLERVSEGVYRYVTNKLTQGDHQLGVYAEKSGYKFAQQSLTITPIPVQNSSNNVKVTAVQQGDILKLRVSSDILTKNEIQKIRLVVTNASVESVVSGSWIVVPNQYYVDLKSISGSIAPGEKHVLKVVVQGKASMVVWSVYDVQGKQISSGSNKVAI